jgi:hypothetical protein
MGKRIVTPRTEMTAAALERGRCWRVVDRLDSDDGFQELNLVALQTKGFGGSPRRQPHTNPDRQTAPTPE